MSKLRKGRRGLHLLRPRPQGRHIAIIHCITCTSLYADIAHAYIIVTLYRPAPRVKNPSGENLMKTFTAAVNVAKGYLTQTNLGFGYSKYVFHSCYHTFSAAVVFLQALERCKELVCSKYTIAEVEDLISLFSRFFATIAERWPAVLRCMEEFERLMVPVKRKYIDFALNHARTSSSELLNAGSFLDQTGTSIESLLNPDYSMDFGSLFPHDVFNVQELVGLPFTIPSPSDWGIEFNLDVDI